MLDGKKVIGLCLTRIHDDTRSEYTQFLYKFADQNGYKLIVYNSFTEFSKTTNYLSGAVSVFDTIDYSIVDVVIIMNEAIVDKSIIEHIIRRSKVRNIPVVILKGKADGCYSILDDYTEAYKQVIRHVIHEHCARDIFFISGKDKNDYHSDMRLKCYKEVLYEEGIEYKDENTGYGFYWYQPTYEIVDRLVKRKKLPDAVICANDSMAIAACERFSQYHLKVPDDILVTGFDGIARAEFFTPSITTCKEDIESLAELTVDVITKIFTNKAEDQCYYNHFKPLIGQSCGCKTESPIADRNSISNMYDKMTEMSASEDFIFSKIDAILNNPTLSQAMSIISYITQGGAFMILNNYYLRLLSEESLEKFGLEKDYTIIYHSDNGKSLDNSCRFLVAGEIRDLIAESLSNNSALVLSPIFVGDVIFGYYAAATHHISDIAHKIKRSVKAINIAFSDMYNRYKQREIKLQAEKAAYHYSVSGLPNMRGCCKWFNDFDDIEQNHNKHITVSVYAVAKYRQIYENYGIEDADNAVKFVAEALESSNTKDCFIGQFSENEFIVINFYNDGNIVAKTINSATSDFFSLMDKFNKENGKDYYVEVNCGCTVLNPGWSGTLSSFIKFASAELYMNKLRMSPNNKANEQQKREHNQEIFSLLIEQNLFRYCFQPIVSAKTGDIYGYEALMRTESAINMSPLDVLDAASQSGQLYHIERATMFNVLEQYSHRNSFFGTRKVFINHIPGYFLNDDDYSIIGSKYGEFMDNVVIEITERNTLTDSELERIRKLGGNDRINNIAVDDYGTGHSNIVNLLRYSPQIIKVDRFLISGVDKDVNKQRFLKSTIEFAALNDIKVLAEGVETSEELKTVISFGVDFIQGYYTGKPLFDPVDAIAPAIKEEIISYNQ